MKTKDDKPDTRFTRMEQWITKMMAHHRTPGLSLAFSDRQKTLYEKSFGYKILESREKLTPDALFAIGSIGKTFTAVAVLQAHEKKLLDLHAPVTDYLPWFEVSTKFKPITTHHLLTHTSGLIEGTDFTPDGRSEVWALRNSQTGWEPGERFHYSNVGYKVVGLVLEAVTGRSYVQLLQEDILEPLEMTDTIAYISHSHRSRLARGYQYQYDDRPHHASMNLVPATWIETDTADGSLASTSGDMAKFARMLLNQGKCPSGELISTESWKLITNPMILQEDEMYYGYGLDIFRQDGYAHIGHAGDIPGYEAFMWLDIDNSLAALVLQTHPYTPKISTFLLDYLRAMLLDKPLPELYEPTDFLEKKTFDLQFLAGIYLKAKYIDSKFQVRTTSTPVPPDKVSVQTHQTESLNIIIKDDQLQIDYQGMLIPLVRRGDVAFFANHPDFNRFLFRFAGNDGDVISTSFTELHHGGDWYTKEKNHAILEYSIPEDWFSYCGHYRSHNPWISNFRIVIRKDKLIMIWPEGSEETLVPINVGLFRIGYAGSPERIRFDQVVNGQALRANRSGCDYYRFFKP